MCRGGSRVTDCCCCSTQVPAVNSAFWGRDTTEIFYTTFDQAQRPFKLWHHRLSQEPKATNSAQTSEVEEKQKEDSEIERGDDTLLYTEADERFYLSAYKSLDHRWVNTFV